MHHLQLLRVCRCDVLRARLTRDKSRFAVTAQHSTTDRQPALGPKLPRRERKRLRHKLQNGELKRTSYTRTFFNSVTCQKHDRNGGHLRFKAGYETSVALPDGRASDTVRPIISNMGCLRPVYSAGLIDELLQYLISRQSDRGKAVQNPIRLLSVSVRILARQELMRKVFD